YRLARKSMRACAARVHVLASRSSRRASLGILPASFRALTSARGRSLLHAGAAPVLATSPHTVARPSPRPRMAERCIRLRPDDAGIAAAGAMLRDGACVAFPTGERAVNVATTIGVRDASFAAANGVDDTTHWLLHEILLCRDGVRPRRER